MYTVHSNILVTIEFDFKNGDKLELKEHYIGIIRFDDFQIKGCRGKEFSFGTIFGAKALNGSLGPGTQDPNEGNQILVPKYLDLNSRIWNVQVPSAGTHCPGTQMKGPRCWDPSVFRSEKSETLYGSPKVESF